VLIDQLDATPIYIIFSHNTWAMHSTALVLSRALLKASVIASTRDEIVPSYSPK